MKRNTRLSRVEASSDDGDVPRGLPKFRLPSQSRSRSPSPSPSAGHISRKRRSLNRDGAPSILGLQLPSDERTVIGSPGRSKSPNTPHSAVLRARLQHVLSASNVHSHHGKRSVEDDADASVDSPLSEEALDGSFSRRWSPVGVSPRSGGLPSANTRVNPTSPLRDEVSASSKLLTPPPTPPPGSPPRSRPKKNPSLPPLDFETGITPSELRSRRKSSSASALPTLPSLVLPKRGDAMRQPNHRKQPSSLTAPPVEQSDPSRPPPSPTLTRSSATNSESSISSTRSASSFNARSASAQCRQMQGYVSFAAVDGLGCPDNVDSSDSLNQPGSASGLSGWVMQKVVNSPLRATFNIGGESSAAAGGQQPTPPPTTKSRWLSWGNSAS